MNGLKQHSRRLQVAFQTREEHTHSPNSRSTVPACNCSNSSVSCSASMLLRLHSTTISCSPTALHSSNMCACCAAHMHSNIVVLEEQGPKAVVEAAAWLLDGGCWAITALPLTLGGPAASAAA